jgi:hypothetical protein
VSWYRAANCTSPSDECVTGDATIVVNALILIRLASDKWCDVACSHNDGTVRQYHEQHVNFVVRSAPPALYKSIRRLLLPGPLTLSEVLFYFFNLRREICGVARSENDGTLDYGS